LAALKTTLDDLERQLRNTDKLHNLSKYRRIAQEIQDTENDISATERNIKSAEEPPPPLLQPLPASKDLAMKIIFFLEMPRHFQVLLRLSFMAQQMLLPRQQVVIIKGIGGQEEEIDIQQLITVEAFELDWNSYYTVHRGLRSPVSLQATLASKYDKPKGKLGPSNVMSYQNDSDGVWHPDGMIPGLWWKGGTLGPDMRGEWFDPWKSIPAKITVNHWVEALPTDCRHMQWAMTLDGYDRGNLPLANQNSKPRWLSKPQFLSFALLRAFPNLQDRKVCVALHEGSLPLEQVSCFVPAASRLV
jgi:hypothetical protein